MCYIKWKRVPQSCPSLHSSAAASPHCCSRLGYSYVPCHRAPLPFSDTSSSSAQLLYSRRPLHLLPLLVPHHSSSSSATSVLVVYSTLRSFAISLSRLARAPGPAFLSPGNCSNFDPRDTARPVGMWTLHMCAPVSLTRELRNTIGYVDIGPYCICTINWEITFFINRSCTRLQINSYL